MVDAGLALKLVLPGPEQSRLRGLADEWRRDGAALAYDWTLRLRRPAAYDSFYLALAETLGADLWTTDQRLGNAVDLPWVRVLE